MIILRFEEHIFIRELFVLQQHLLNSVIIAFVDEFEDVTPVHVTSDFEEVRVVEVAELLLQVLVLEVKDLGLRLYIFKVKRSVGFRSVEGLVSLVVVGSLKLY